MSSYNQIVEYTNTEVAERSLLDVLVLILVELRLLREQIGDGIGVYQRRDDW